MGESKRYKLWIRKKRKIHGRLNASWKISFLAVNGQSFLVIDGYLLDSKRGEKKKKKSKKSIASFKIREDMDLGLTVTLRGQKMYSFLTKLIFFTFSQIRDFRGLSVRSFDKAGNYTFGLKEQLIFPEIDYEDVEQVQGFTITLVFSSSLSKAYSKTIYKVLNGMILLKFLRFPLNDCGYYEKYDSLTEVSKAWDKKKQLRRKRWSQE